MTLRTALMVDSELFPGNADLYDPESASYWVTGFLEKPWFVR
jgi:hypothetical protein